jgi:hypothetical protein
MKNLHAEIEENLINYLSGWVARKSAICRKCQQVLVKQSTTEHLFVCGMRETFSKHKRYSDSLSVSLINACGALVNVIHTVEASLRHVYPDLLLKPNLAMSLYVNIYPKCDFGFLFYSHPKHAIYLSEKLTKMYVTIRIYYAVKFANQKMIAPKATKTEEVGSARRNNHVRKVQKILHK